MLIHVIAEVLEEGYFLVKCFWERLEGVVVLLPIALYVMDVSEKNQKNKNCKTSLLQMHITKRKNVFKKKKKRQ